MDERRYVFLYDFSLDENNEKFIFLSRIFMHSIIAYYTYIQPLIGIACHKIRKRAVCFVRELGDVIQGH